MMYPRTVIGMLLAASAFNAASAQPDPARPRGTRPSALLGEPNLPIVSLPHTKFVLPNGLTVIVNEDHQAPVVSINIYYHVGSAHETPGRTGFAHLFEHLMFQGSKNADRDGIKALSEAGATGLNATTNQDRTEYHETVSKSALDRVLWLEADRMANLVPAMTQAKLDRQRGVVQNEKRQRANDPLGLLPQLVISSTYPANHPYSWETIGSMEDLNAASLEDVGTFFKKWYGPNNAVLVLSGDITTAEARTKVERYFGGIPAASPIVRSTAKIAKMSGTSRAILQAAVPDAQLVKIWNVPGLATRDAQVLELVARLLGGGQDSRLNRRLVRDDRIATSVSVSLSPQELGSQLVIQATAKPGVDIRSVEAAIDQEVSRFLRLGPNPEELGRLKFSYYANSVRSMTSTAGKASELGQGEIYTGNPDHRAVSLGWVYASTPATVTEVANRWLSDGQFVVEIVPAQVGAAPDAKPIVTPPPIAAAPAFRLPPLQHARLSNGMKIALAERHDVPAIDFNMMIPSSSFTDDGRRYNQLSLATTMTRYGTRSRSALAISRRMEDLGASIGWNTSNRFSEYRLVALKLKLDESLDLYADLLTQPTFPADEWSRVQANAIAAVAQRSSSAPGKVALLAPKLIYGAEHPYAQDPNSEEYLRAATPAAMSADYRKWIRPDQAVLLIVGDTTLAEILPKLERHLGKWRAPPKPVPARPEIAAAPVPSGVRVVMIDQPGAESTIVQVFSPAPPRGDPQFDVMEVANSILGGGFVSRLNMNLREDKHWSYGANSSLSGDMSIGNFSGGAVVQSDKTGEAMKEIDRELREIIAGRPPSADEVSRAKFSALQGLAPSLQRFGTLSNLYRSQYQNELGDEYWNSYPSRITAMTDADIGAATRRFIRPSQLTWIVAGDLSRIEREVRALNLGEVSVVDVTGRRLR